MKQVLATLLVIFSSLSVASPIETLVHQYVENAHIGLLIQDADSQKILYAKNIKQSFTPASITKSFTTAATLMDLDPKFTYQTALGYEQDNLVLIFNGDPTLTTDDLKILLQNVDTIKGDIIIDNTYFSRPFEARGWVSEDLKWYFGTPAKSVIIDENQIAIKIIPSKTLGQKAEVKVLREDLNIPLSHQVITVSEQDANTLCQLNLELNPNNNGIHLYGCWPTGQETTLKVALANPELRVKEIILERLAQYNIPFTGQIKIAKAKIDKPIATHQSPSLLQLNTVVMQASNNLYADSLIKVLGKKHYNLGTLQAGSYAMTNILKDKLGLNTDSVRLFDGSGGSTYNKVTPEDLALLLQAIYNKPEYKNLYLDVQKVDAQHTFYQRLTKNITTPLYLKTGSMTGVSNIAGYIKTKTGRTLILVCLLNGLPLNKTNARAFETALIEYLAGT
jgi:D-alanyl-D-alanine carboxypeptidase/D-alanyl-D-alanine-endopeptidase (penicillin-binding protein 4)